MAKRAHKYYSTTIRHLVLCLFVLIEKNFLWNQRKSIDKRSLASNSKDPLLCPVVPENSHHPFKKNPNLALKPNSAALRSTSQQTHKSHTRKTRVNPHQKERSPSCVPPLPHFLPQCQPLRPTKLHHLVINILGKRGASGNNYSIMYECKCTLPPHKNTHICARAYTSLWSTLPLFQDQITFIHLIQLEWKQWMCWLAHKRSEIQLWWVFSCKNPTRF